MRPCCAAATPNERAAAARLWRAFRREAVVAISTAIIVPLGEEVVVVGAVVECV